MTAGLADQRHRPATGKINRTALTRAVERVFRGLNTDLLIRPIRHRLAGRVRAHVLIRLLAYYVTWHMQQNSRPCCSRTTTPPPPGPPGPAPRPAQPRCPRPPLTHGAGQRRHQAHTDGAPVQSLATLLADLATIAASHIQPAQGLPGFTLITTPTPIQRRALELLGITHRFGHP